MVRKGRVCFIGIVAALLFAPGARAWAQTCVAPPAGIVGWWPGNGTAADSVAGNNAHLVANATFAPGVVGQGFKLDGVDDLVEIPDSPTLKPAHVSVEAWVRFDSLTTPIVTPFGSPGLQYIVFKKNTRMFNFEAYALRKQRVSGVERLAFSIGDITGVGTIPVAYSTTPIVVGTFYHVVGTYDGTAVRLYVNGVLEGEAAVAVSIDYDTDPVFIGSSGDSVFDGKLNGVVDEAAIYNRALAPFEAAALHAAGSAGKCGSVTGQLASLTQMVQALNLSAGISNSFDAKLRNALEALDDANTGNDVSVCNRMLAFINEVSAQSGSHLSATQAGQLITAASQIRSSLSCSGGV